jgi:hypothetical protein
LTGRSMLSDPSSLHEPSQAEQLASVVPKSPFACNLKIPARSLAFLPDPFLPFGPC